MAANEWLFKVWDLSGASPVPVSFHQYHQVKDGIAFQPVFTSDEVFYNILEGHRYTFHIPSRRCDEHRNDANYFPSSTGVLKITDNQVFFTDGRPRVRLEGMEARSETRWSLSPDDRFLAQTRAGQHIDVWDVETGKVLLRWKAHDEPINTMCFSPDGKLLATGDSREVKLWNLAFILREREKLGLARSWPRKSP